MDQVLVGVDGSQGAKDALRWAASAARGFGANLRVVLVPSGDFWSQKDWASPEDVVEEAESLLDSNVEEALGDDPGVALEQQVKSGDPRTVLTDLSAEVDLLVVGSRGQGKIAGAVLGSVSQHLVTHARCPVTVVPGDEEA